MSLTLRAKLRLPEGCSQEELCDVCNRYYSIYKGVLNSSVSEPVKAVAAAKLKDLTESALQENITLQEAESFAGRSQPANMNATVEEELSNLTGMITPDVASRLERKITALPNTAKRYYLSAQVQLQRNDRNLQSLQDATERIRSACSNDPGNPAYTAVLDAIIQELNIYNNELEAWKMQEQARIDAERRKRRWRAFFEGLGSAIMVIGGIIVTVAGAVFSCICGLCDGC